MFQKPHGSGSVLRYKHCTKRQIADCESYFTEHGNSLRSASVLPVQGQCWVQSGLCRPEDVREEGHLLFARSSFTSSCTEFQGEHRNCVSDTERKKALEVQNLVWKEKNINNLDMGVY